MKILVAVNDLQTGTNLIAQIQRFCAETEAVIKLVTVIPSILGYTSLAVVPALVQELRDDEREDACTLGNELLRQCRNAISQSLCEHCIIEGAPAEEILAIAEEWRPDLLVVGSRGNKGIRRMMLGSVSQALVSNSDCSVLVCKTAAPVKEVTHAASSSQRMIS